MGEHGLAECGRMQRKHRADLQDLQARVRTEDVMDDEDTLAVGYADPDGLVGPSRKQLGPGERACAQLTEVEVAATELEELRAELILVAVRVLLDEPVLVQRPKEPVDGALREPEPVGKLAHTEAARTGRQGLQNAD